MIAKLKKAFQQVNYLIALPIFGVLGSLIVLSATQYQAAQKAKSDMAARQISEFYSPLDNLLTASTNEWVAFRSKHANDRTSYFQGLSITLNGKTLHVRDCAPGEAPHQLEATTPEKGTLSRDVCFISQAEIAAWATEMRAAFKPYHEKMENLIIEKRFLAADDSEIQEALDQLLLHISGYKSAFLKWESANYSQMTSHNNFPAQLRPLIKKRISTLSTQVDSQYSNIPQQKNSPQAVRPPTTTLWDKLSLPR